MDQEVLIMKSIGHLRNPQDPVFQLVLRSIRWTHLFWESCRAREWTESTSRQGDFVAPCQSRPYWSSANGWGNRFIFSGYSESAYEQQLDRLLESKHFGERMALEWLDLARYADSNGFQSDGSRDIWMWREWLIVHLTATFLLINLPLSN